MTEPPPLHLEWREDTPHLVLGASPDPAALGQRQPVAAADGEPYGGQEQPAQQNETDRASRGASSAGETIAG